MNNSTSNIFLSDNLIVAFGRENYKNWIELAI